MKTRGFTLLELLVAMAITLLLAGLLLSVTTNILSQMQRAQGASSATTEAKLVLDQLERDLQGAILRNDGKVWMDLRVLASTELAAHGWRVPSSMPIKPVSESIAYLAGEALNGGTSIARARFGISGVWLRFLTADYDGAAGNTVPVAVSYQIVRQQVSPAVGAPVRYALYRTKMAAGTTLNNVLGSLFTATAPAGLVSPSSDEVIASNVVDFGLWVYARTGSGQLSVLPIFPTGRNFTSPGTFPVSARPAAAKIMVRILTEEGAALIQAMEEGRVTQPAGVTAGQWWWQVVESHSHVFTRHVELLGEAP